MGNIFSAFRLKKTTANKLQTLKRAFEITKAQPLSNDFFIEKIMDCVKSKEKQVWKTYTELLEVEERASAKSAQEG